MDKLSRMKMSLFSALLQSIILVLYAAFGDYARAEDPYQVTRDNISKIMGRFPMKKRSDSPRSLIDSKVNFTVCSVSGYSRDDFHRFRLFDDFPEALRVQCCGVQSAAGVALHPMGYSVSRFLQDERRKS